LKIFSLADVRYANPGLLASVTIPSLLITRHMDISGKTDEY
jgi:hypothetical protein